MNWLHYLLEANLYLMVFYTGYCLFLNKETYYTLNRVYLLLSCILSFLLPMLQIGILKPVENITQGTFITVITAPIQHAKPTVTTTIVTPITLQDVLLYAYLLGVAVLTIVLLIKLFKLIKMTRVTHKLVNDQYKMVSIEDTNTAFSFFNYLFIGSNTTGSDVIIRHELVHIKQKHSVDILFMEVMKIMNWFNPFIYLVQISLKTVHEYIADEQTAAVENDALTYSSFLVSNAYGLNGSSITHSFFNYNLLKKRIIMLNQKRSGNLARLKYLVAAPLCVGMLCASTLGFSKTYGWIDLAPQKAKADTAGKAQQPRVPKYMLQPPPPPTVVKNGYTDLFNYLNKTVNYPKEALKTEKSGLVVVSVNIKNDHKLTDIKITKKASDEFNNEVLKALSAYNGTIADKPGEHTVIINFCTDYRKFEKSADAAILKNMSHDLDMIFYNAGKYPVMPPPPVPVGINKKAANVPPPPPPVPAVKVPKVLPPTPAVKAPKVSKVIVTTTKDAKLMPPPPPPKNPFDSLYRYIARHVRYPAVARENHFAGRIIANFNINNGKIEDVKITRGLDDAMDGEVMRVLKNYDGSLNIKSGKYAVPVSYRLVDEHDNSIGKEPEYKALANNKSKSDGNNIMVSDPVSMLNEIVIYGYAATKK